MSPQIYTIKFGSNRCYIIKSEQVVMVDAGPPKCLNAFKRQLSKYSVQPGDINPHCELRR